jgi:hypothetical protein
VACKNASLLLAFFSLFFFIFHQKIYKCASESDSLSQSATPYIEIMVLNHDLICKFLKKKNVIGSEGCISITKKIFILISRCIHMLCIYVYTNKKVRRFFKFFYRGIISTPIQRYQN